MRTPHPAFGHLLPQGEKAIAESSELPLHPQIALPLLRLIVFQRVAEHYAGHPCGVPVEEGVEGGTVGVGGAEHPAGGFVDQVLGVVEQQFGDGEGVVELAAPDEGEGGRMAVRRSQRFWDFASR